MALALPVASFPTSAYASYENLSITGTAQVKTDASLHVSEQRAFKFDEQYSALEWSISGTDIGTSVNVSSVRALNANKEGKSTGKWRSFKEVPFNPSWRELMDKTDGLTESMNEYYERLSSDDSSDFVTRPKSRTFSFDSTNDRIFIFPKAVKKTTVYECSYNISNAARVYDDVAELYWTYSLPTGDDVAKDIHMKIQLPVPEDAKVRPNENVYAWGHGPDGAVDIRKDGVIDIKVAQVRPGQYSMVHIVFPRTWLRNVDMKSESYKTGTRLGYALSEEEGWSDVWAAREMNYYAIGLALCALCLLALIASIVLYFIYGREKRPAGFDGPCVIDGEDGPSKAQVGPGDEGTNMGSDAGTARDASCLDCEKLLRSEKPAVCGRLLRWNHHSAYDLAYVLQKLIDEGVVQITLSPDAGKIRLRLAPSSKSVSLDEVDQSALYLVFETIGDGYQSVSIDDIRQFCDKHPTEAFEAMREWQKIVSQQVEEANVFDRKSKRASYFTFGIAAFMALVGVASFVLGFAPWGCLFAIVVAIACAAIAYNIPRRTQAGVDLADKLEKCVALRGRKRPIWEEPLANAFGDALTA